MPSSQSLWVITTRYFILSFLTPPLSEQGIYHPPFWVSEKNAEKKEWAVEHVNAPMSFPLCFQMARRKKEYPDLRPTLEPPGKDTGVIKRRLCHGNKPAHRRKRNRRVWASLSLQGAPHWLPEPRLERGGEKDQTKQKQTGLSHPCTSRTREG